MTVEIVQLSHPAFEPNSKVLFLFSPKHRWQKSGKTGKMQFGKTNDPVTDTFLNCCRGIISSLYQIENVAEQREACGKPCLIQN